VEVTTAAGSSKGVTLGEGGKVANIVVGSVAWLFGECQCCRGRAGIGARAG